MNPAEPVTRTLAMGVLLTVWAVRVGWVGCGRPGGAQAGAGRRLVGAAAAEGEQVPPQVRRQEPAQVEVGVAELPVQPDGGDLGYRQTQPGGLGGQLQTDLEAGAGFDPDPAHETGVVSLE